MNSRILNVLLVDDNIDFCRVIQQMLSGQKYQLETAQSVAESQKAITRKRFDCFVVDYNLPDGTGLAFAEQIRSKGSRAPIILITGYQSSEQALKADELQISASIQKPFSKETICSVITHALGGVSN